MSLIIHNSSQNNDHIHEIVEYMIGFSVPYTYNHRETYNYHHIVLLTKGEHMKLQTTIYVSINIFRNKVFAFPFLIFYLDFTISPDTTSDY